MAKTLTKYQSISPTAYADGLGREQFMDIGMRELWPQIPRIAGPAYTARCMPGDNLMLHAAIYRAAPGEIIVVEAGDSDYAISGGNVCAIAQKRGIAGFIIDGAIRDIAEVREARFPVFARGCIPKPGKKAQLGELQQPIICGGVRVFPKDIVIADEEGIAVVPHREAEAVWKIAKERADKDATQSLSEWESAHRTKIEKLLLEKGFVEPSE
ncbi:conserved domain protein [Synechococcus sp. PCC 7335]|uniref:RraA family protein n=1 Tax=Synechococcus sp. (strain ATCC 29403 / PCC 7335) TaxID=91464 RepID=UPI00017EC71F|nr:RraA family protein [Synechococcus sp. PCC 7335]EDX85921.1 conserved domain protein [Synechococcus sp. PCC 7335]